MSDARITIMPVAAALGALAANLPATPVQAATAPQVSQSAYNAIGQEPNTLVSTGQDLLGFMVDRQADGTMVAYHTSHASHASHHSHYSSR